jgi:Type I phosphodiesterase / nucleotide pyrophosphatase
MNFQKFLLTISFIICLITNAHAQPASAEPPRLVIGIMVDGLQQKHLELMWHYFNLNGFRQIIEKGATCQNVNYNILSGGNASDAACVMTGSTPFYNGISGNYFFRRESIDVSSIIQDATQEGIGTNLNVSAKNLLASTVMDELILANEKRSKCHVVAINPEEAIMMGGHAANSVTWIDDEKLQWVTTGYYTNGLSKWADDENVNGTFSNFVNRTWKPLFDINSYLSPAMNEDKKNGFVYEPGNKRNKNTNQSILRNTPSANELVTGLGIRIFNEEQLGTDNVPDLLMLQYSVRIPNEKTTALKSAEKEDMYMRLDKNLANLLQTVSEKISMEKVLVVLFANQTDAHSADELKDKKIPSGHFNASRSMALLSNYLIALYGQEKWISGYYGKNIFLNRHKIEEKKKNYHEMQQVVADFMLEFEGIQSAYTASQMLNSGANSNNEVEKIKNSLNKKSMGDVVFTLLPGWTEVDEKNNAVGESNAIKDQTPLYFFGWQIRPQKIPTHYEMTDVAPTLSKILNITMPNACIGKPITEIVRK